jgi:hypothetical protein
MTCAKDGCDKTEYHGRRHGTVYYKFDLLSKYKKRQCGEEAYKHNRSREQQKENGFSQRLAEGILCNMIKIKHRI